MTPAEKARCVEWVKAHAKNWQTAKRAQWKYEWHGKVLVRFLDNVSMREIEDSLILEYLTSPDCMETLSLYSQSVDPSWTPTSAWYEAMTNRTQVQGVFPVRLYHALRTDPAEGGDGPYIVENGCMWKVTFTFYWHQTKISELPASSSGVNYRISNINRDDEDGTFSYILECRERVQQDLGPYVSEEDMEKKVVREEHKGVKQGVEAGPDAGIVQPGTVVTRSESKNEDCTHDVSTATRTDKPVTGKVVEKSRGIRGTRISETNLNQPEPLDDSNLAVGEGVRNEKTETGLWNTTHRTVEHNPLDEIRKSCGKTIYRHTHSETTATSEDPGFSHVENAEGGVVHEKDVQRTEDGYDVTETTRTDNPVERASVTVERRLGTMVTTTHNRSQPSAASTADLRIGDSVRNDKTESGVIDQTIVETEPQNTPRADESCEKNRHVHTHSRTDYLATDPGTANADEVANGTIHSERVRKTDAGGFAKTEETRTARPSATVSVSESEGAKTVRTDLRNVESVAEDVPQSEVNRSVETSARTNDFDLQDGAVAVTSYRPMQRTTSFGNAFYDTSVEVMENEPTEQNPDRPFSRGVLFDASSNPNGHGSATVRIVRRSAKPILKTFEWYSTSVTREWFTTYKHKKVIFRNQIEPPEIGDGSEYETIDPSLQPNEFGLWDGVYTYTHLVSVESSGIGERQYNAMPPDPWDNSTNSDETEYKWVWQYNGQSKKKEWARYKRTVNVRKRLLHSSIANCYDEIMKHPGIKALNGGWMFKSFSYKDPQYAMIYMYGGTENLNWTFDKWDFDGPPNGGN